MARALLLVDPQNDFISGSLPVPGAAPVMDALALALTDAGGRYALKIITLDAHPWNHCSFRENGGPWPRHCVADSAGAAIYGPLLAPVYETSGEAHIIKKGRDAVREEYSAFQAHEEEIKALLQKHNISDVEICGLAGDVCVLQTLKDGMAAAPDICWTVLENFSPSLDGGKALREYCEVAECARS